MGSPVLLGAIQSSQPYYCLNKSNNGGQECLTVVLWIDAECISCRIVMAAHRRVTEEVAGLRYRCALPSTLSTRHNIASAETNPTRSLGCPHFMNTASKTMVYCIDRTGSRRLQPYVLEWSSKHCQIHCGLSEIRRYVS